MTRRDLHQRRSSNSWRASGVVIVANRLPVEHRPDGTMGRSPGGLASALASVADANTHWIGWAGADAPADMSAEIDDVRLHPIELRPKEVERYYQGFANSILWPLFHGRLRRVELNRAWWHSYRIVNGDLPPRSGASRRRAEPSGFTTTTCCWRRQSSGPSVRIFGSACSCTFHFPTRSCSRCCRGAKRSSGACSARTCWGSKYSTTSTTSWPLPRRSWVPGSRADAVRRRPHGRRRCLSDLRRLRQLGCVGRRVRDAGDAATQGARRRFDLPRHRSARLHQGHLAAPPGLR